MAYVDGVMYFVDGEHNFSDNEGTRHDGSALYTINLQTGVATFINELFYIPAQGETLHPRGFDVTGIEFIDGIAYVVDENHNSLFTIDLSSGEVINRFGSWNTDILQEYDLNGLVYDGENLYTLGEDNNALFRFDLTNGLLVRVGSSALFGIQESNPLVLAYVSVPIIVIPDVPDPIDRPLENVDHSSGTMYMAVSNANDEDRLHVVDLSTGVSSPLSSVFVSDPFDDFNPINLYYANGIMNLRMVENLRGIVSFTVNLVSGVASEVSRFPDPLGAQRLFWVPGNPGTLYMTIQNSELVSDGLYRIDFDLNKNQSSYSRIDPSRINFGIDPNLGEFSIWGIDYDSETSVVYAVCSFYSDLDNTEERRVGLFTLNLETEQMLLLHDMTVYHDSSLGFNHDYWNGVAGLRFADGILYMIGYTRIASNNTIHNPALFRVDLSNGKPRRVNLGVRNFNSGTFFSMGLAYVFSQTGIADPPQTIITPPDVPVVTPPGIDPLSPIVPDADNVPIQTPGQPVVQPTPDPDNPVELPTPEQINPDIGTRRSRGSQQLGLPINKWVKVDSSLIIIPTEEEGLPVDSYILGAHGNIIKVFDTSNGNRISSFNVVGDYNLVLYDEFLGKYYAALVGNYNVGIPIRELTIDYVLKTISVSDSQVIIPNFLPHGEPRTSNNGGRLYIHNGIIYLNDGVRFNLQGQQIPGGIVPITIDQRISVLSLVERLPYIYAAKGNPSLRSYNWFEVINNGIASSDIIAYSELAIPLWSKRVTGFVGGFGDYIYDNRQGYIYVGGTGGNNELVFLNDDRSQIGSAITLSETIYTASTTGVLSTPPSRLHLIYEDKFEKTNQVISNILVIATGYEIEASQELRTEGTTKVQSPSRRRLRAQVKGLNINPLFPSERYSIQFSYNGIIYRSVTIEQVTKNVYSILFEVIS